MKACHLAFMHVLKDLEFFSFLEARIGKRTSLHMLTNAMGSARVKACHLHILITLSRSCLLWVLLPV